MEHAYLFTDFLLTRALAQGKDFFSLKGEEGENQGRRETWWSNRAMTFAFGSEALNCRREQTGRNKNRLCSKTCGMDMNSEGRKIWKTMKNPRERWTKWQKDLKIYLKWKFEAKRVPWQKNHKNKKIGHCWAYQVKFELGGHFRGQKPKNVTSQKRWIVFGHFWQNY